MTAKLSKAFYDRIGEQAANELVDWFNSVDATYRADLERINELNFARFEAKLDQRMAEVRLELHALKSDMIKWMFVFWSGSALAGYLLR